ncbi:hypothetical protein OEZ85_001795 [Tetradesmus obliquus]|uniref:Galactose oxidase-like Early set domain-containing protein n=1 Tax=Tetradesmus obliquus TaxID=3088 RepID=A0ABY8U0X9_TETOB|nr:hypothetical protein OEZ85_001795 [Tetradesmus obliquus]
MTGEAGQYMPLLPAPYDPDTGVCTNRRVNATVGSFTARASSTLGIVERMRFAMARSVATDEAQNTCEAAAAPTDAPVDRQGFDFGTADATRGEWRVVRNRAGRSSTGVVGINAVLLPESSQVLFWARVHMDLSRNYEPGVISSDGVPEVTSVYDPTTGEYTVKRMRLTPFCTGNSHLRDGRVLAAGGDDFAGSRFSPGYTDGRRGLRLYQKPTPGTWDQGGWNTLGQRLASPRWYPTQTLLPDGVRTVITGGTVSMNVSTPVPSAEIFSQATMGVVKQDTLPLLQRFAGFILYPVVYVLPFTSSVTPGTTHLFMFNCDNGAVMRLSPTNTWSQYRDIPASRWPTPGFCGAMSMAGTATMLMLEPTDGYAAEVVMFGGFQRGRRQCDCDTATMRFAHRMRLDKASVDNNRLAWTREAMPYGRNMNDVVLLPNGQLIIVNGAKTGVISNARDPAHDAWLYNPRAASGSRFTTLAATNINRYYHSTALLLPDASLLIAGCEYGTCTASCARPTAWQFQHQAERFLPPYFFQAGRPVITSISATSARYGATLTVGYTGRVTSAVIITPAAVTHQNNMNQRAARLVVVSNTGGVVTLRMPPNQYVMQPGWHMLFLMNGDVPCTAARWVQLRI